jgi:biotin-dependent carboxylase-like uncharacterized protein
MIKVLKAGFYTTIQDRGRAGFAAIGVPVSGVMDTYSADLANHILNNNLDDAVLEITLGGCQLEFLQKTIICISGGDFTAKINDKLVVLNSRIEINKNDVLSFGRVNLGFRTYLAVKGGFLTPYKLGSRSFYPNVTKDFLIRKGDVLDVFPFNVALNTSNTSIKMNKNHFKSREITCFKGPEFELLNKHQKELVFDQVFTISGDNNRMGYRLQESLNNDLPQILTSSVLPGTVQLTPSGKIIVLMRDCQVTGGYPRILKLTGNAINQLSQKTTNDEFQFVLKN